MLLLLLLLGWWRWFGGARTADRFAHKHPIREGIIEVRYRIIQIGKRVAQIQIGIVVQGMVFMIASFWKERFNLRFYGNVLRDNGNVFQGRVPIAKSSITSRFRFSGGSLLEGSGRRNKGI
jgi:hypothetical protein